MSEHVPKAPVWSRLEAAPGNDASTAAPSGGPAANASQAALALLNKIAKIALRANESNLDLDNFTTLFR